MPSSTPQQGRVQPSNSGTNSSTGGQTRSSQLILEATMAAAHAAAMTAHLEGGGSGSSNNHLNRNPYRQMTSGDGASASNTNVSSSRRVPAKEEGTLRVNSAATR